MRSRTGSTPLRTLAAAALVLSVAMHSGRAAAQTSDAAFAEALFEEGRALMQQGDHAAACAKFRQSHELDPAGGTVLNLSACLERSGKTASAWSAYKEALNMARRVGHQDRTQHIEKRLKELEGKLPRITLRVAEDRELEGMSVKLDGIELGRAAWGSPMPVDPGRHELSAVAPGRQPFEREITLAEGEHQVVEIPPLEPLAPEATEASKTTAPAPAPVPDETSSESDTRTLGYALGGAGLVALGVGSYFGVRAFSEWDRRNELCTEGCMTDAVEAYENADTAAAISTVSIGVGVAALAAGAYFVFRTPGSSHSERATRSEPRSTWLDAEVSANGAAVTLGGAF